MTREERVAAASEIGSGEFKSVDVDGELFIVGKRRRQDLRRVGYLHPRRVYPIRRRNPGRRRGRV